MSTLYSLKIGLYNFFGSNIGKNILESLSSFVYVKNLKKNDKINNIKNKKFIVAVTIDTESGYTNKDNSRVWQKSKLRAYIGFYKGIENWRNLLNKYNVKATFFLSTNCFSARDKDYNKIMRQLKLLLKEKHEVGLHLHPDSDLALQEELNEKFDFTSARFYSYEQIKKFLITGKNLIKKHLGINVSSFRWGNWAFDTNAVKALHENKFKIDSSATPGIKGHLNDGMHYDWVKVNRHYPWLLSLNDYQNIQHQNSKIAEIPIATFNFMGMTLRADPVYSVLLKSAFDYYYKNADRSKKSFAFVVISHSIEAIHQDGTITKVIKDMEEFLKYAKKFDDVEFVTINEAYNRIK